MTPEFLSALSAGTDRLAAWSDLLDSINVFPVADGDTGRNLVLSLSPLRVLPSDSIIEDLLLSARGNSGNIAVSFFTEFLSGRPHVDLAAAVCAGRRKAFGAVPDPKKGTMLDIFDTLEELTKTSEKISDSKGILNGLKDAVIATTDINPKLKEAMVVDSGALGMFIFFDAFFNELNGTRGEMAHIVELFDGRISISEEWKREGNVTGSCIDFVVKVDGANTNLGAEIGRFDDSVVSMEHGGYVKVHLHAESTEKLRDSVSRLGTLVKWSEDDLGEQTKNFKTALKPALHILTDAAGSVTRSDASRLGFTLLDSYITLGRQNMPETCMEPELLYAEMRRGVKATTAQASVFERHQHYEKVLGLYGRALYLCVGSAFTRNYQVACDWKAVHDPENRLAVMDTGAASGRLGLIIMAAARYSIEAPSADAVIVFAEKAAALCEEYVFIDRLQYLVAGGRVSKAGGFFADMLNVKPIVSPQPEGVKKLGTARSTKDQINFALKRLRELLKDAPGIIMLEYSDNRKWLEDEIKPLMLREFTGSETILQPLSLTSGTHMGPGTWAVAAMPGIKGLKIIREG